MNLVRKIFLDHPELLDASPKPKVIWHGRNDWEMAEVYTLNEVTVPKGFRFDGASIPRPLWWWKQPAGIAFAAGVIHDWLYRSQVLSRREADLHFYQCLIYTGARPIAANILWGTVRLFGGKAWNKNASTAWRVQKLIDKDVKA